MKTPPTSLTAPPHTAAMPNDALPPPEGAAAVAAAGAPELLTGSPGEKRRGLIFMVISLLCFTANTLLLKYLGSNRQVDPAVTMLFRAVIGGLIVLSLTRGRRPPKLAPIFKEPLLIWRGILGVIGTAAYYWTVPALGAGKASLLCTTYVLFGALFAAWFLREFLSRLKVIWLMVAFVGTALLTSAGQSGGFSITPGGYEAFAIVGAIAAAGTIVIIRHLTTRHSIATIFLAQCVWIGITALPFAASGFSSLSGEDYLLLTLAATTAGYGQLAMNESYRLISVAAGSSVQMALPVMAAIGGILMFGESYSMLQLIGAGLILFGSWQVAVRKN